MIKLTKDKVIVTPLLSNIEKPNEESKTENYIVIKSEFSQNISFVISVQEDGSLNAFLVTSNENEFKEINTKIQ